MGGGDISRVSATVSNEFETDLEEKYWFLQPILFLENICLESRLHHILAPDF